MSRGRSSAGTGTPTRCRRLARSTVDPAGVGTSGPSARPTARPRGRERRALGAGSAVLRQGDAPLSLRPARPPRPGSAPGIGTRVPFPHAVRIPRSQTTFTHQALLQALTEIPEEFRATEPELVPFASVATATTDLIAGDIDALMALIENSVVRAASPGPSTCSPRPTPSRSSPNRPCRSPSCSPPASRPRSSS